MKKFFLSGVIVASVVVALAATHKDTKNENSQVNGYGIYCSGNYNDTIPKDTSRPRRDTTPRPDTPPRLKY